MGVPGPTGATGANGGCDGDCSRQPGWQRSVGFTGVTVTRAGVGQYSISIPSGTFTTSAIPMFMPIGQVHVGGTTSNTFTSATVQFVPKMGRPSLLIGRRAESEDPLSENRVKGSGTYRDHRDGQKIDNRRFPEAHAPALRHRSERLLHAHQRNGCATAVVHDAFDDCIAAGAIQRLAGQRRHQLGASEALGPRRRLAH